jgi:hypothetical protein
MGLSSSKDAEAQRLGVNSADYNSADKTEIYDYLIIFPKDDENCPGAMDRITFRQAKEDLIGAFADKRQGAHKVKDKAVAQLTTAWKARF